VRRAAQVLVLAVEGCAYSREEHYDMTPVTAVVDGIDRIAGRAYHPIDLARVNDQVVRMALFKGDFHWHIHENEDELFYVVRGRITIQMRPPFSDIVLTEGELAVVPKGVEHCPVSDEASYVLMFAPASLKSAGDGLPELSRKCA
jgi:mannose-6-phosphate isomerase-like protein (cupin superfamily)